jgi:hypothetical protein
MLIFFIAVTMAEFWRAATTPLGLRVHAFIDGTIALYLALQIVERNGKDILPPSLVTASVVVVTFVGWAMFLR